MQRPGHRGGFLAAWGVVYILIGYSYLAVPPSTLQALRKALRLALNVAPLQVYAWLWIAAGAVGLTAAFVLPGRRAFAFIAAVIMPALWSVVYFAGWADGGVPRGWVQAAIFAALATAVTTVSGMPDPKDLGGAR